ncbi:bacillithiol biosynthesis cysteine-adding enzyme BshC [Brevibacillus massiliensis]|jgi:bacillithiol biosynthesis cysteine-adding enzyme BshC|uniref:bacillithiol biosynthesis cysteine-adding enzyme BshC n=1 Tax=Brevibacillus massiliensis TaxID=1118054 RepID=UPI0002DACEA2|nr:bacillithiol biosynthesis cysteine-adding enzyme BshC [Brevibacillus massiliensis]
MDIQSVSLPLSNRLADDYLRGDPKAASFFTYLPYEEESYRQRLNWLRKQHYPHREQLADGLLAYNRQLENDAEVFRQIEKLRHSDTYVVIGGQQAGVMTGPLYTIHKAVTLIQTARHLQEMLQVDIVPVFWIAGEDHDLEEINHLYYETEEQQLKKLKLSIKQRGRFSASMLPVAPEEMIRFADQFLDVHPETDATASLRRLLHETAQGADTLVEWFALLMARLFGKHGLVLVESSSPFIRSIQRPVFRQVIEQPERMAELLREAEHRIRLAGYEPQLELSDRGGNLFLYEAGERLLLEYEDGRFSTKDGRNSYSREQLLGLLETEPERFSANVVTRPLSQEHIFPTLAFAGGPGEIAYWAFYKECFAALGYQLPIILPRTSITLVDRTIERSMKQFGLGIETVMSGFREWQNDWLASLQEDGLAEQFASTRKKLAELYLPLLENVVRFDAGLSGLADKNLEMLLSQVDFLEKRVQQSLLRRHEVAVKRLKRIEAALIPEGVWQERVYSVISYMNKYGLDFVDRLAAAPLAFGPDHKVVYL